MKAWRAYTDFIHRASWGQIPSDVQHMAARCILDLTGTLIAGSGTNLSQVARDVAATTYRGDQATLMLDGRRSGAAGAALANGMTIDSVDAHDGYRLAKGHAGAGGGLPCSPGRRRAAGLERRSVLDRAGRRLRDRAARGRGAA